jgi:long-chain acyl-CoA synthetase
MQSVEQQIWRQAASHPDKLAVKSGKDAVTYGNLVKCVIAAKNYLQSLPSYAVGQTVILAADKQIEFLYAYFGAHLAGLVVAPIDGETNPTRFGYIADMIRPFCVIGFQKMETTIPKVNLKDFKTLGEIRQTPNEITFPEEDSIVDILFTTGTTGAPKGVPLTCKNEAAAVRNINSYIGNAEEDIELLALPVSHSFGLGRVRCCLSNGQTLHLLGSFVNVKRLYRTMEEEKITGFSMVPASWKFLQKMSGLQLGNFASQLKYIEMGSAYFSEEDKRQLARLLPNTRIVMHYGLTEASRSAFMEFHDDEAKLSTVGKASPYTDIQVFDENGGILQQGEEGEICVKGEHVTRGYLNLPAEKAFYGDYFRTGDSGTIDTDGYISLKARIKELINVGGKKVAPTEVDEQIMKIPGVEDCACVAMKDPEGILGELVKAFVVRKDNSLTSDEIISQLTGKLESYKIPVQYEWIDVIPKTKNGKILRNLLRNK